MIDDQPQQGNPHRLTRKQHVFPARSLNRFVNSVGTVEVLRRGKSKTFHVSPSDQLFCARRLWDQQTESGYMKEIEDKFQILAERVAIGGGMITEEECLTASRFSLLWQVRAELRRQPMPDTEINLVTPDPITKDQRERLEKLGAAFINPDQTLSGRFLSGFHVLREIDKRLPQLTSARWGVVTAHGGEFLLPESFGYCARIPVTPGRCLVWGLPDMIIPECEVAKANRFAIDLNTDYLVARDFTNCPR